MSEIFGDFKFFKFYEWVCVEGNGCVIVGIFDYVQGLLGDLVYVELFNVGDMVKVGEQVVVVELVKVVLDVYSLIIGIVVEVNSVLLDKLEIINEDVYGEGWIFVVEVIGIDELNELLVLDDYVELLENEDY